MHIVVCIKQVPDTSDVKINPETNTLIREGVVSIINPFDENAVEAALVLKEKLGAKVTVMTMGPPQAESALRETIALGVDDVVLLSDRAFAGSDTWATSYALGKGIAHLEERPDLILFGKQAIDGDTAQVGPQIAEHLGLANISYAENIKVEGDSVVVKRQYEDRYHVIKAKMPCLITALSEMNTPRYMTPGGIFDAYREKEVKVWTLTDLPNVDQSNIGLKGSPTRVFKSFTKALKSAGTVVKLDPQEAAEYMVEKLQEKFII